MQRRTRSSKNQRTGQVGSGPDGQWPFTSSARQCSTSERVPSGGGAEGPWTAVGTAQRGRRGRPLLSLLKLRPIERTSTGPSRHVSRNGTSDMGGESGESAESTTTKMASRPRRCCSCRVPTSGVVGGTEPKPCRAHRHSASGGLCCVGGGARRYWPIGRRRRQTGKGREGEWMWMEQWGRDSDVGR